MADAGPAPLYEPANPAAKPPEPVKPAEPEPARPNIELRTAVPTEAPKLVIASTGPQGPPPHAETKPPEPPARLAEKAPPAKTAEKPKDPPRPEQHAPLPTRGPDLQNLLALSPLPAPLEQSVKVPSGEARGRFAISPEPNLTPSEAEPGSKREGLPSPVGGIGSQAAVGTGNAAAVSVAGVGAGSVDLAGGGNGGVGTGAAKGKGSGNGGTGMDTGGGSEVGPKPGVGSASGTGTGPGRGAFPGITIQGGRLENGTAGKPASSTGSPVPPQRSYGLTIVSTANSGGGLADFGVFSHEQVYTVYLDMRRTMQDPAPSWTLQYAVLRETASQTGAAKSSIQSQEGLVPPFPVVKELPELPVDLVHKYLRRLIVVFAIINREGKLEQMSVKQSPDIQLKKPLFETLSKWVFRPAELNGEPVSVKVLLGIPLWLSQ